MTSIAALSTFGRPQFSLKEQVLFTKRLAFLITAGVPIVEALHLLRTQASGGTRPVLDQIVTDVSSGQSLSRSLTKFPRAFGAFSLQVIRVGESSGTLSQNLQYLADELKKREALRRKIVGACIYPALITAATIGITIFLITYLFPKITPVFASLHADLPLSTRIVMAVNQLFLQHGLLIAVLLLLLGGAGVWLVRRNSAFKLFLERCYLRLPVVGTAFRSYHLANGSRTLSLLLKSGVQLSEALLVTADTTGSRLYGEAYRDARDAVLRGDTISKGLASKSYLFPDLMIHMLAVGERSGTLSDTLLYLSDMHDADTDDLTRNLSTLVEPALMLIMGSMVGFIALSIITPIYGITQNLHA